MSRGTEYHVGSGEGDAWLSREISDEEDCSSISTVPLKPPSRFVLCAHIQKKQGSMNREGIYWHFFTYNPVSIGQKNDNLWEFSEWCTVIR